VAVPRAKRFTKKVADAIHDIGYFRIRCGDHRFIAIWVVVVDGRAFVRSWNDKPGGWYRAFRRHPAGTILVGGNEVPIRAVPVRSAKVIASATEAYAAKYTTKANLPYVKGFRTPRRRSTTLELLPLA
jgi:hypothetical protein